MSHPLTTPTERSPRASHDDARAEEGVRVALLEESIDISKRLEETGRIRIAKTVRIESVPVELESTRRFFDVTRRSIGELREECPPAERREGDATVYSVVREVPVVVTRYELVEEIVVTPRRETDRSTELVDRRAEQIEIERRD